MFDYKISFRLFIVAALTLVLTACTNQTSELSEQDRNEIEFEVQQSFESLVSATEESKWDLYFDHFDKENFSGLNADGTTWESFSEFKAFVLPAFEMIEESLSLDFPVIHITVINHKTAILVNEYDQQILLTTGQSINTSGGGTQVWSKANRTWKLVSISASSKS